MSCTVMSSSTFHSKSPSSAVAATELEYCPTSSSQASAQSLVSFLHSILAYSITSR